MSKSTPPDLRAIATRLAAPAALVISLLLSLQALWGGFCADDISIALRLEGRLPGSHHALDLYRFSDGTPQGVRAIVEGGGFPWFTAPGLKLAFFRPLASALWWVDHALFGRYASLYHLHSLGWYLLLVYIAWRIFRRALPPELAGLAAILFAMNDSHAMAVGWLSSRHAPLAASLTLAGLLLHLRAREEDYRPGLPLSLLCYALGLCAGETALGALAYLYAYELLGRTDRATERLKALLPSALLALGYLILYKKLGYGVAGSAGYLDPLTEPAAFLRAAPERTLLLIGSFLGGVPADLASLRPEVSAIALGTGAGLLLIFYRALRSAWAALEATQRRSVRWLGAGAALSLVPNLGGVPGSRLLLMPSLGGVVLLALLFAHSYRSARRGVPGARPLLALLLLLQGVRPPLLFSVIVAKLNQSAALGARVVGSTELPASAAAAVVVLASSDPLLSMFGASALELETGRSPRAWWTLSMAKCDHEVTRLSADTLELSVKGGRMLDSSGEKLFRNPARRFQIGDVVPLRGAEVRVLAEQAGHPTRIAVRFDRPLDDPTLWFAVWRDGALRRVSIPEAGQVLPLPHTPGPMEE